MSAAKISLAALSLTILIAASAFGSELQNFVCLKCHQRMTKAVRPNAPYCKAGGSHHWHSLGKAGPRIHICLKCDMLVKSASRPNTPYCKAGGSHNWFFLGLMGRDIYVCRKCNLKVRTSARPNAPYCKAGGSHDWFRY